MTEILSQAEIDELLNALNIGEDPEAFTQSSSTYTNIKPFDFRKANKFPKEQMRTLNVVFQSYGQLLATHLTGILRTSCECELLSIEEITFNEFNNSLPSPVILAILNIMPLSGSVLMQVSSEVAYIAINRLLGGAKSGNEADRPFTEIEMAMVDRVIRQTTGVFQQAWEKVIDITAQLDRIETSTQFTQIVALNEPVALVSLSVNVGEESGIISICVPHVLLQPVAKQLNTRMWFSSEIESRKIQSRPDILEGKLIRTPVTLTAYFEETPATVYDIMNLQAGDVIRLNQKVEEPLLIKVQHIPKFHALIGTSGSNYALQIVNTIKGETNNDTFSR